MKNGYTFTVDDDFTLEVVEDEAEAEEETVLVVDTSETEKKSNELEDIKESIKKRTMKLPDTCPVPFCTFRTLKEEWFNTHLDYHICFADISKAVEEGTAKFPVKCPVSLCLYESHTKQLFFTHMDRHLYEKQERQFKCSSCNYITLYKNALSLHRAKCDDAHKLYCTYKGCSFVTVKSKGLRTHMERHLHEKQEKQERQFKCSSCNFVTERKNALSLHLAKCNYAHKLQCTYEGCNFVTIRSRGLRIHIQTQHLRRKNCICKLCNFTTDNKADMQRHRDEMHRKVKCKMCSFSTDDQSQLDEHKKRHSNVTKVTIYKCDSCDYESEYMKNVIRHHGAKHAVVLDE